MTGPQHYRQAEALLEEASDPADHGVSALHAHIAMAQVHATLALALATVESAEWFDPSMQAPWQEALR